MSASADSSIYPQVKKIDGLSIRYAESEPREVSAILLSPWPESLYTFEQMWSRLAEHAQQLRGGDREGPADLVPGRGSGATDRAAHRSGRAVQWVGRAAHGVISCQPMLAACGDPGTALRSE